MGNEMTSIQITNRASWLMMHSIAAMLHKMCSSSIQCLCMYVLVQLCKLSLSLVQKHLHLQEIGDKRDSSYAMFYF